MKTRHVLLCLLVFSSLSVLAQSKREMPFTSSSPNANKLLRNAWVALGDFRIEDANRYAHEVLEQDPDCAMAYASLFSQNKDEVDENMKQAGMKKLSTDERLFLEAVKARRENRPNQEYFEPLIRKYPSDNYLHLWAMYNSSDPEKAIEIGETIIRKNPKFAPAYNMLGYLYMNKDEMAVADNYFTKYISLRPDLANPYDSKGDYFMRAGRVEEAIPLYEKAAALGMTASKTKADRARARLRFPQPSTEDASMIQEITAAAFAGYKERNVDDFVKHQAEQAVEIFPDQRVNIGKPNIRMRASNSFQNATILKNEFTLEPIRGAGPIAVTYGTSQSVVRENISGKEIAQTFNTIFLYRKGNDGDWKIIANHYYGWNEEGQPLSAEDRASIGKVIASWEYVLRPEEILTETHVEDFGQLFSPQAIELFGNLVSNVGLPNLKARWSHYTGSKMETNSLGMIGIEGAGRRAIAWGIGNQHFYAPNSTELQKFEFPWAMILTKEKDDVWRILVQHWGAD